MLIHASVVADDPRTAARSIARLCAGEAVPMPGPGEGTWTVFADRAPGAAVEVLRRGSEFHPVPGRHVETRSGPPARASGVHLLLETPLNDAEIVRTAAEEGLPAWKAAHGFFSVWEVWLDDCFLLELMTPEMAARYRALATLENARALARMRGLMPLEADA